MEVLESILVVRDTEAEDNFGYSESESDCDENSSDFNKMAEKEIKKNNADQIFPEKVHNHNAEHHNQSLPVNNNEVKKKQICENVEVKFLPVNTLADSGSYSPISDGANSEMETSGITIEPNMINQANGNVPNESYQIFDNPQIVFVERPNNVSSNFFVPPPVNEDPSSLILSNQTTILKMIGQLCVNIEKMQSEISDIKCFLFSKESTAIKGGNNGFSCLEDFPINDENELEAFNTKLKDNRYKNLMVSLSCFLQKKNYISNSVLQAAALRFSQGSTGVSVQANVNSMMAKLFDDNLMKNYSALGVRGKRSFAQYTSIQELIWQAIKLTFKETQFQESVRDVFGKMGVYMKHAPARIKNEKVLKERKENVEV